MALNLKFPEIPQEDTEAVETEHYPESIDAIEGVTFSSEDGTQVLGGGSFLTALSIGDWIYNWTDDWTEAQDAVTAADTAAPIKFIESNTALTLPYDYQGTAASGVVLRGWRCENEVSITGDLLDISGG